MTPDTIEWPPLAGSEVSLTDTAELLWRQVHPQRLQDGRISSEAFEPGSNDGKKLSCSRESVASAAEAYEHHVSVLKRESAGSAAISVDEVQSAQPIVDGNPDVAVSRAIDDSATAEEGSPLPPGHTYIDYRPYGSNRITKKAKQLAFYAAKRGGIQHPVPEPEAATDDGLLAE